MRYRVLAMLVGVATVGGVLLAASPSGAMVPTRAAALAAPAAAATAPAPPGAPVAVVVAAEASPAPATAATAPASCPRVVHGVSGPLPQLTAALADAVDRYARNVPASASASRWYDSGGSSGGGVPASAVRDLMRRGLANGLDEAQVGAFLAPSFLRGMNDPQGGPWLFAFIAWENDPTLYQQLATYAQSLEGPERSPMIAQADVFGTFPLLQAAYMAEAGAVPPTTDTAAQMLALANAGYAPAQRAIQAFLASGNHPSAGAQDAGGVGDGIRPAIYDAFVQGYDGPLSPAARQALVNRGAYDAWVARIAAWQANGGRMNEVPAPATFPAVATGSVGTTSAAPEGCAGA